MVEKRGTFLTLKDRVSVIIIHTHLKPLFDSLQLIMFLALIESILGGTPWEAVGCAQWLMVCAATEANC